MDSEPDNNLRGTKRKADEAALPEAPRRIRALAIDVVNKIAAGEIIVAPVHALKELVENAVDAGSTSLEIMAKEGGLKFLQITDNGHGIDREDLPILCERFTTSKLKAFEDLTSIGTYGFRGEALASISHIAHLSVTTRTKESSCAWRAHYSAGKLAPPKPGQNSDPKPIAGRQGTQITVEDLFYNIPTRRKAFRSASEEYAKILDLVGRYAVHCGGVSFSCKKHGDSAAGISVPSNASIIDRIRHVHGSSVANELIEFQSSDKRWGFESRGWVSNANYSVKRTTFLLFINHRSVESSSMKRAIEQTFSVFLPKGGHPFIYLSLEIDPQRVDVNIHPTKREVNFLNEEEIIEAICAEIRLKLSAVDSSRTFFTQTLLPGNKIPTISSSSTNDAVPSSEQASTLNKVGQSKTPQSMTKVYENSLVRTDSQARKITSMFSTTRERGNDDLTREQHSTHLNYEYIDKEPTLCRLTTVKELRSEVRENIHDDLSDILANHSYIGIVDSQRRIAAIQGGVKLFLMDYGMLSNEYFYQVGLTDFGNFGTIRFDPPLDLRELLAIAVSHEKVEASEAEMDWELVVEQVRSHLIGRKDMLNEYFSLDVSTEGKLVSIPLLVKGYMPSMAKLPQFLLRLGPHVTWSKERDCFQSFLRELASFYVPEALPSCSEDVEGKGKAPVLPEDTVMTARRDYISHAVENVLFPAFKARLVATKGLVGGIVEVANLRGLYRVFERC